MICNYGRSAKHISWEGLVICIDRYLNLRQKKDAIIPDILLHNHPTDENSTGVRNMEAIFDIKPLRIDINKVFYSEIMRSF